MVLLLAGLVVFLGIHSLAIYAPQLRASLTARLGAGYRGVYSLIALAGLWMVVQGFREARLDPVVLYVAPAGLRHLTLLLMLPVFPLLVGAYLPGHIKARLKHPMLVATKLWAVAHLLVNGRLADVVLFGAILAWAVIDRISLKRRAAPPPPAPRALYDVIAVGVGLALYVAFVAGVHLRLFGVSPMGH